MEGRYKDKAVVILGQLEEGPGPLMTEVRTEDVCVAWCTLSRVQQTSIA
jgi:ribosomal protein L14E/L6E/L27E